MPHDWRVEWSIIPYSRKSDDDARREESARIREKIQQSDAKFREKSFVILLDERGDFLSSPQFSRKITSVMETKNLVFVLGGAYGVDDDFRENCDFSLSFSRMVFPHQIARLVLVEQIYRAFAISRNLPYHHE